MAQDHAKRTTFLSIVNFILLIICLLLVWRNQDRLYALEKQTVTQSAYYWPPDAYWSCDQRINVTEELFEPGVYDESCAIDKCVKLHCTEPGQECASCGNLNAQQIYAYGCYNAPHMYNYTYETCTAEKLLRKVR